VTDSPTVLGCMLDVVRRYQLTDADGTVTTVQLRFFDCAPVDDGSNWRVCFNVLGLESKYANPRAVYGVDALQAFLQAITVARAVLESHPSNREGRLSMEGAPVSAGLGLGND
jgi:hypothetical protein